MSVMITRSLSITGSFCGLLRGRRNEECKVASQTRLCRCGSAWEKSPKIGFILNHEVVLKDAYTVCFEDSIDKKDPTRPRTTKDAVVLTSAEGMFVDTK